MIETEWNVLLSGSSIHNIKMNQEALLVQNKSTNKNTLTYTGQYGY